MIVHVGLGLALDKIGMAWAFTRYLTDPEIAQLEKVARGTGIGLWADSSPVPPWEWRRR